MPARSSSASTSPSRWPTRRCPATTAGIRTSRPRRRCARASEFRVECREWTDAQLGNNDSANDVRDVDLTVCHMLSGPIEVQGAEPGDLLVVDILDLGPCQPPQEFGDAPGPGLGLHGRLRQGQRRRLPDRPLPRRLQGDLGLPRPGRHVAPPPGRALHGHHPPGPVRHRAVGRPAGGVEPPRAGADRQGPRPRPAAGAAAAGGRHAGRHAERPRAATASAARARARCRRARTAATTTSRTSRAAAGSSTRCTSPGAKLSGGDLHFSQGDGEITFCGAIEMGGFIDFGVDLIKGGMNKYGITTNPILIPGRVEPRYSDFLTFIGVSVDETTGENYYLDATIAYRRACLNAIEYLQQVRLHGRAGVPAARLGADRGPHLRRRRHPERVLLALPAHRDLRLRRAAEQGRPDVGRPRRGGEDELGSADLRVHLRGLRTVRAWPADGRGELGGRVPDVRRRGPAGVHPAGRQADPPPRACGAAPGLEERSAPTCPRWCQDPGPAGRCTRITRMGAEPHLSARRMSCAAARRRNMLRMSRMARELGRYEILERIGTAGWPTSLSRVRSGSTGGVALKELSGLHARRSRLRRAVSSRGQAGGGLCHPNIVTVYDDFEHAGRRTSRWSSSSAGRCARTSGRRAGEVVGVLERGAGRPGRTRRPRDRSPRHQAREPAGDRRRAARRSPTSGSLRPRAGGVRTR